MSSRNVIDLSGKHVLVTGGASGLGADMSRLFACLGAKLLIADIDGQGARGYAESLGGGAQAVECDISDEDSVTGLTTAAREFGGIDALINNAALIDVARDLDLLSTDLSVWDRTLGVNLRGTMLVSRAILPLMIEKGAGAVVTLVSRQGIAPPLSGKRLSYGTSKAGLIMLARHMAVAYGKLGIRSNAVAPGTIQTARMLAELSPARLEQSKANVLTPYLGTPTDVSSIVAFLISDAARYITGQTLQVDGGVLTGLHE
ncbi:SDR family NAD(P)-dependent oxidoreductase [Hyphomonas johnsonii]|uniref:SDR-family protein n=1 Tax=Hyphomonas johnsonii MHS-2 TaxID=1280950 RepID=A0A059FUS2_9PROT|nr:SDR family NAD(P)-dependent oxidoreductase [Hyphomonas johnsonii]KCZ94261.1 SDR-family protein [Hyphomonas johnsonii MHS-2]